MIVLFIGIALLFIMGCDLDNGSQVTEDEIIVSSEILATIDLGDGESRAILMIRTENPRSSPFPVSPFNKKFCSLSGPRQSPR
jgi:hypothetical protein